MARNANIHCRGVLVFIRHEFCNEVFWQVEKSCFFDQPNELSRVLSWNVMKIKFLFHSLPCKSSRALKGNGGHSYLILSIRHPQEKYERLIAQKLRRA